MTADLIDRPPVPEPSAMEQRRNERLHDQAVIRQGLRRLLAGNKDHHTLWDCGNPVPGVGNNVEIQRDSLGHYGHANLTRCGSKQCCVTCAGPGRAKDAALIAWRVNQHLDAGGGVSMLTVAPRHQAGERLAPMKAQLMDAFSDAMRSQIMQRVMDAYGMVGTAKVFECTCGENGFHPHLHVLLFHERFIDVTYGEELEFVHTFWRIFNQQLGKWAAKTCRHPKAAMAGVRYSTVKGPSGRPKATYQPVTNAEWYGLDTNHTRDADLLHGINFVPITRDGDDGQRIAAYVGKIQLEMTRSDLKTGKTEGSRSIFQIMADYGHQPNDRDAALILEALDVLKGTQLVSWSGAFNDTDPLYGEPTKEFQEAAMAEYWAAQGLEPPTGERQTVAHVAPEVYRAADRARSLDGHPLLWKARLVLEQTGQLEAYVQVLNEVLDHVVIDRTPDLPYPLIRYGAVEDRREERAAVGQADEWKAMRANQRAHRDCHAAEIAATARQHAGRGNRAGPAVEGRQAPPGGWLDHWKIATPDEIKAELAKWEERWNG